MMNFNDQIFEILFVLVGVPERRILTNANQMVGIIQNALQEIRHWDVD